MASGDTETSSLFKPLSADDDDQEATEIESLCMNCEENGVTRLLLTKIPFYKEVVIMSFRCDECGFANNEIQPGGKIQETGVQVELKVTEAHDLDRQVVKSDYCSVTIPELDFEIPAQSQKGEVTTVEGVLDRAVTGLESAQPLRKAVDPKAAEKIDEFIQKLKKAKALEMEFTLVLNDISGNSFVQNFNAPKNDPSLTFKYFNRNGEQDKALGLYTQEDVNSEPAEDFSSVGGVTGEVFSFGTNCPNCNAPCETNMKVTDIPHFKQVVIMATNCPICGHKTNEVKPGAGLEEKGRRITLHVTRVEDLKRDVVKSETCGISVPELEIEAGAYTTEGRFTTVEGLFASMKQQLYDENPLVTGDSADVKVRERLKALADKIGDVIAYRLPVHVVLDDPAGNSYIENLNAPDPDPALQIEDYERTFEQNDELGLNDMKTENYQ